MPIRRSGRPCIQSRWSAGSTPPGFVEIERDEETGAVVGWEPAAQSSFAKWLAEADTYLAPGQRPLDGHTYELVGPKVNGNPEGYKTHLLIEHAQADVLADAPRDFAGLTTWLHAHRYEGIVWHHPDGRMAKIKKRDFRAPATLDPDQVGSERR